MKIKKYNKWFVILKNGFVDYTQEEEYASIFQLEQAVLLNEKIKGELIN
ncbi:hypothetical protein [uncultured Aquimarina sp.]|nr:hypothetical protein [uncultured Aquimarina sp.]